MSVDHVQVLERIAQIQAHRAVHSTEHDPANGKCHGYCIVCGVPFPCEYVGSPPICAAPRPAATQGEDEVDAMVRALEKETTGGPRDIARWVLARERERSGEK